MTGPSGRSIATSAGAGAGQDTDQFAQARGAVLDGAPADLAAAGIDDATRRDRRGPSRCRRSRR